ncbi:MAG: phage major capsid protein [Variovorax sp.]
MPPDIDTVQDALTQLKESVKAPLAELTADVRALEQRFHAPRSAPGNPERRGAVGELVVKGLDVERLRGNSLKTDRTGLETFFDQKATIVSGSMPMQGDRDSEIYGPLRRQYSVRDLLQIRPTTQGSVEYLRGTRTGAAGIQATEGDVKAELALGWTVQTATVRTIAVWVPASRQILDDATELMSYIDNELRDALLLTEDAQLLSGNGIGSNIQGLMTASTAYNRTQTGDKANDTLRRAITQVQLSRGVATGIVINPEALERLELEKDTQGRYITSFAVQDANGRTVTWRVPVVVTDAMLANSFLVGDFLRAARLYDRRQAAVEVATQHADFFTRNLVAILAEERLALTINRPDLLVSGSFPAVV